MSTPDQPEQNNKISPPGVEDMLAAPDMARLVATDEFKELLDNIPIAIVAAKQWGNRQRIIYANTAFEALTGQTLSEIENQTWAVLDRFVHEDEASRPLGQAVLTGEDFLGTFRLNDDKPVLVQAYVSAIEKEDGGENYRLAALVDVTERARAQREEFERQIRDKDLLLREIQHRVKNNLQLLIAMIRLEGRAARRGDEVDLERLASRIESLQLLYQALSADALGTEVDLGHYLSQIASTAMRTHSLAGIELALKVNHAPVSINIALPIGLAVNELLTNVFKYAFVEREQGTITLECLRENDENYTVVVADDGVGLPDGLSWPSPGKLGALVMQTLRENANSNLQVVSTPGLGTRVTITFNHKASPTKAN